MDAPSQGLRCIDYIVGIASVACAVVGMFNLVEVAPTHVAAGPSEDVAEGAVVFTGILVAVAEKEHTARNSAR